MNLPQVIDELDAIGTPSISEPLIITPTSKVINENWDFDSAPQQFHDEEALQFTFPIPMPEPVSLWRPPLYDVPWALAPFDHFYFVRPIAADEVNWPLPNYRYGGIFSGTEIVHTGIDIPAPRGTLVQSAGVGEVVWTGYGVYYGGNNSDDPYGLAVTIKHDFGYQGRRLYTIYAHLDRIDVINGQQVEIGTPLGIVGMTGNTTGPHLHFEVRIEDNSFYSSRNPELWLVPPQEWGVLVGQLRNTNGSFLTEQVVKIRSIDTNNQWYVISYGHHIVNRDEYFQENLVLGDLPAGYYEISIDYLGDIFRYHLNIFPGAITYFTFRGEYGFGDPSPPSISQPEVYENIFTNN
ncbi:MAG: M23 family metallopeptidase [Anaerolineaceae bacterium]|nr:M23 family metallopeptidase [Anaerolineaceae bacterium]